jgi:hypothetical protein
MVTHDAQLVAFGGRYAWTCPCGATSGGFTPDRWEALLDIRIHQGFTPDDLLEVAG